MYILNNYLVDQNILIIFVYICFNCGYSWMASAVNRKQMAFLWKASDAASKLRNANPCFNPVNIAFILEKWRQKKHHAELDLSVKTMAGVLWRRWVLLKVRTNRSILTEEAVYLQQEETLMPLSVLSVTFISKHSLDFSDLVMSEPINHPA